jgi:hypothetical protein
MILMDTWMDGTAPNDDDLTTVPPTNVIRHVQPRRPRSNNRFKSATRSHGPSSQGSLPEREL